ncbi:pre-toxin TG domain-containing protein [Enterococcus plantarum]|uniref:pre-toxin TG domain-containing protein n=1 Tax=Enterococcus plantarum TaxID=1077675 RepID=UPI001A8E5666|nr:pre-toxin TG domain-containing protein [Enterococcus plantarum]MBO0422880.1 hypothetical protein [Enterococcus plantarum]
MKVTLEDILGNSSPLADYLRVEYNQMKQQIGDVSFEEYKNMAFVDTSFDYYSRNEKVKDLAVTLVINGAVLVVGGMLPWPLMVALGLTSGGKNISEAWRGKNLFTGKDLSTGDRILRGLSGVADVALAGYGTYKGIKPVKGTTKVIVSEKASGAGSRLDINIKNFEIKNKHLNSSTAKRARKLNVSSAEEANKIVQDALKNGKLVETIPNGVGSQGQNSFSSIIDTGKVIGTKGETHIKIVYDELKNVWTTYPVPKP